MAFLIGIYLQVSGTVVGVAAACHLWGGEAWLDPWQLAALGLGGVVLLLVGQGVASVAR